MQTSRIRYDRARSYQVLRTAHLERAHDFRPASIFYGGRRYDFDDTLAAGLDLHRCGPAGLALALLRRPPAALEINEPLQTSGLLRAAVAVAAARLADLLHRRHTRIGAYAIENRDPFAVRPPRLRSRFRRGGERLLSRLITARLDRIAYGTDGAAALYADRLGRSLARTQQQTFSALPTACDCPPLPRRPDLVLYLGALHRRKGVLALLDAWPTVIATRPSARLLLVGKGDLEDEIRDRLPEGAELVIDPPRPEVHYRLRTAHTLVLFSQPTPHWREQVGLPIVEGLAHGTQIVTSDQTGLAEWLASHGQQVLAPDVPTEVLAGAIVSSLDASVGFDLPDIDGRRAADDWLLHDGAAR